VTQALIQITPGMTVEQLPCSSCTAMCCGPVPISEARLQLIREHLRAMPGEERRRLAHQERGDLDCGFLDKDNYHCTIYPMRPWVCEAFGRVEGMVCPKVDRLIQIIPSVTQDEQLEKEIATPIVSSSDRWNWKRMDFE
jgi:Fe-S-cluster containining protein